MVRQRSFTDKFWHDSHGKLTVWQRPNKLLLIWAATVFLGFFTSAGWLDSTLGWVGRVAIIAWALLEITLGDSYFRRLLGALVLALLAIIYFQ